MSVFDAAVVAMSRTGDVFDRADNAITWLEGLVADTSPDDWPTELHVGADGLHIYDPRQDAQEQLQRAHALIREAELIWQRVLAACP